MNADDFHPFWKGVFHEFGKQSDAAEIAGAAAEHPGAAAAVGGAGLLAGLGAVALKRKLFKGKAPAAAAAAAEPAAQAAKGFSGKALLGTGVGAGAVGYYYGGKKDR